MLPRIRSLARGLFRRDSAERNMNDEMRFHVACRTDELIREGVPREEAERRANIEFGSNQSYKEQCRQARGLRFFDELSQDVRYAMRSFRHKPGFIGIAVLSLAIGIGANTSIFSLLDALLLRSLPVADPPALHVVRKSSPRPVAQRFSYPTFVRLRDAAAPHAQMAAMGRATRLMMRVNDGDPVSLGGQLVSGEYFSLLGLYPVIGRVLTPEDNRNLSGHPVAVISHSLWQRHFGGSPAAIGSELSLNGTPFNIVGVAPAGFSGLWVGQPVDVWMPLMMQTDIKYIQNFSNMGGDYRKPWVLQDEVSWVDLLVRVRPESRAMLHTAINTNFQQSRTEVAQTISDSVSRQMFLQQALYLEPCGRGFSTLRSQYQTPLYVLMGLVGVVLLICCANVANLLLARANARHREMAVRLSMGAGRGRLIRQMLVESLMLAAAGGAAGLLLAQWSSALLLRISVDSRMPVPPLDLRLDLRVLAFTAALSLATAILFGLVPALRATRVDPGTALKAGARTLATGSRLNLAKALVSVQVALSLVLLVGAALFVQSLQNLIRRDPGFARDRVVSVTLDSRLSAYSGDQMRAVYRQLVERIEGLPGVRSAAAGMCGIASGCQSFSNMKIEGYQRKPGEESIVQENMVGPKYFATVGIEVVAGRAIDERDISTTQRVAVVNEAMVRRYFPNQSPIGRRIGWEKPDTEIVGVVRDARLNNARDAANPMAWYALNQTDTSGSNIDVRTAADPAWMTEEIRKIVRQTAPGIPIERVVTLAEQVGANFAQERLVANLTTAFGALALLLASVGLYGVMSYAVSRRTAELGIRMALGAPGGQMQRMVLRESLLLVLLGIAAGVPLVFVLSGLAQKMLFGVSPHDPLALVGGVIVLTAVTALAAYLPALRASKVDPMVALRYE